MATESFYEDMVIDTPEKAARIEALFRDNIHYIPSGSPSVPTNDPETIRRLVEKYCRDE